MLFIGRKMYCDGAHGGRRRSTMSRAKEFSDLVDQASPNLEACNKLLAQLKVSAASGAGARGSGGGGGVAQHRKRRRLFFAQNPRTHSHSHSHALFCRCFSTQLEIAQLSHLVGGVTNHAQEEEARIARALSEPVFVCCKHEARTNERTNETNVSRHKRAP